MTNVFKKLDKIIDNKTIESISKNKYMHKRKSSQSNVFMSIRFKFIMAFLLSIIAALMVVSIAYKVLYKPISSSHIVYKIDREYIDGITRMTAYQLINEEYNTNSDEQTIQHLLDKLIEDSVDKSNIKVIIVGLDEKILFKSKNVTEDNIQLFETVSENLLSIDDVFYSFCPVKFEDTQGTLLVIGKSVPTTVQRFSQNTGMKLGKFISYLLGFVVFLLTFLFLTKKKVIYFEYVAKGLTEISKGNLNYRVKEKGFDELGLLARNINIMAEKLKKKIEEEKRDEKIKNELITNISHDLRTPLTSVMGYLKLIKDRRYESETQIHEYTDIAYGKSERLKILIDDLFEYTKLSSPEVKFERDIICLNELLKQLIVELTPIAEENSVNIITELVDQKVMVLVDNDRIARALENLLMNAIIYCYKPSDIRISMVTKESKVTICFHNKGENIPKKERERIFERFYKVGKSRNTNDGGSGLGLAITKSIIELHGGKIFCSCKNEDIKFFVELEELFNLQKTN